MGDHAPDSYGYDDMFDTQSFMARFHSARARTKPTRDLNRSLFRSSGFTSSPYESSSFEDPTPKAKFPPKRTQRPDVVDGMPTSVSEARYLTSYTNEGFVDEYDEGYSNYVTRKASVTAQPFFGNVPGNRNRTWTEFSAN